jgi:glyoxylase-like metal-dependent hydrolase (beta-lactamase superfamily II)
MNQPQLELQSFDHGITAVDTQYLRPGLDASHLIVDSGRAAFVDTGTSASIPHLLTALERLGIARERVDYVLLTHIHLDHAGGAGQLMQALPNARAVIHPRGARHMIDPAKLIAGSQQVYGERRFLELYGDILPIPESRVLVAQDGLRVKLGTRELELIHTPGHALHHYCIVDTCANAIFSGDNFGVSYREFDTAGGEFIFPTTTPVQFDPAAMHASLDRLMSYRPRSIYLTHFSRVNDLERLAADLHAEVDAFVTIARHNANSQDRHDLIRREMFDHLYQRLRRHGVQLSDERIHELLDMDVELNTQGLEVWLERSAASTAVPSSS